MKIFRDLTGFSHHPYPVVALGNFDGVHLGHRAILKAAMDRARAAGGTSFALTFDPLPAKVLFPQRAPRLIMTPEDKLELLRISGIDGVLVLTFTHELSKLTPRQFAAEYLVGKIGVREVVVGHSVNFGHRRTGNAAVMVELGGKFGFDTTVVGPVKLGTTEVSSTRIRELIAAGDVRSVARLLGRYHFFSGRVIHGRKRGRSLGFPTANIENRTECVPPDGVYATRVIIGRDPAPLPSITNIGVRPTFGESTRAIESHIFDFNRDLYGQRVRLELVEHIRGERKFASPKELADQIALDIARVKEVLATA